MPTDESPATGEVPDRGHPPDAAPREGGGDRDPHDPVAVVAIGASAGGLPALKKFFRDVPANTGAAFVVLQHLAPDQPSLTPDLLGGQTRMGVHVAEDGARLSRNEITVLPPGRSLRMDEEGALRLERARDREIGRSVIDTFLRSLAGARGGRAIAIILSGSGSDGTIGLKAVKEKGGVTMAQDPEAAEFDGMPWSAIRTGAVDYVAPVPELTSELTGILSRGLDGAARRVPELPDELLAGLSDVLREHTGHDFGRYKSGTLTRRLWRRLQLLDDVSDPEAYVDRLRTDPAEAETLFRDLLIGVTEFFRDHEAWDALAETVLPQLFAGRDADDEIRVWVPGAATGEDAYSVAILAAEHAATITAPPEVTVFGTDIDDQALAFAREGLYPEGIADSVSPDRLERFFEREDEHFRISKRLREACIFAPHNVLQDPPFSDLGLVVCRNLLIYLQPEGQKAAIRVFQYGLEEGGFLFLGSSENVPAHRELFETVDKSHRIFRRNERHGPPPVDLLDSSPSPYRPSTRPGPYREGRRDRGGDTRGAVERLLLQEFGPGAVLVNEHRQVRQFFGRSRRFLEPAGADGSADVLQMALPALRPALRSALREAEEEGQTVTRQDIRVRTGDEKIELVEVTVRPTRALGEEAAQLLIVFRSRPRETDEVVAETHERSEEATRELEEELRDTRERLQATIEELESSNEELQSSNEELLSMNEELQTSKEETQSVNEELSTVNAELNAKVAELDEAHSDLKNLFRSTQVATLFLDKDYRIQRFTPSAKDLFRLRDSDVGRSLNDITQRFENGNLREQIDGVLETLAPRETEVRTPEDGRWYTLKIAPYRTVEDVIEGVVVTFTDITRIKKSEERLRREREYAASIFESAWEPIVLLDADLRVLSASRAFYETFGLEPERVRGHVFLDVGTWDWEVAEPDLRRIVTEGEALEGVEMELDTPGAGHRHMRLTAHAVHDGEDGEDEDGGERVLVIMQDITELKERQRAKEQEAERKDWFLTLLGHELRNPLAPLRSGLELLRREAFGDRSREEILKMLDRQVGHLQRLVDDLLDLSRIASGSIPLERERVDLCRVVREAVADHGSALDEGERTLTLELPDGEVRTRADATRVHQAIENLLSNARKYTSPGDRVTVSLGADRDAGIVRIAVSDTGEGMDEALVSRALEPFERGGEEPDQGSGLGVGLTLVRGVADAHGGSVAVASEGPGRGSTVTVFLPLEEEGKQAPRQPAEPRLAPDRSLRVLVVEDRAATAAMSRLLLESEGHEVETAEDGTSALGKARSFGPDVILCDLGLPGGMDGFEVAEAVRSEPELNGTALVAITGFGQASDRERSLEAGFDAFLVKPVRLEELNDTLAKAVREDAGA